MRHTTSPGGRPAPARASARVLPLNRLLARLPLEVYRDLATHLEPVRLAQGSILHIPEKAALRVLFPRTGMGAITHTDAGGQTIDVALIGCEGLIGLPALVSGCPQPAMSVVRLPIDADVMTAQAFRQALERPGPFLDNVNRYTQAFLAALMQSAACNALHSTEKRAARWLLEAHDRTQGSTVLPLTHEELAVALGVRRASVTLVAGDFQRRQLIGYSHGRLAILDRAGLEATACECYAVTRGYFTAVFPPT